MVEKTIKNATLKNRKVRHLALLFLILILLVSISLLSYNEIVNEKKLQSFYRDLNETERLLQHLDATNLNYIQGQESLFKFLISNNEKDIQDYFHTIHEVKNLMDTINLKDDLFETIDIDSKIEQNFGLDEKLGLLIDSVSQRIFHDLENHKSPNNELKRLSYDQMDVKTTIESTSTVDSVEKKSIFGRLGAAIKGDVDVQKEKTEVLMVLEYQGKKSVGSIENQMQQIIEMASDYYEKKLSLIQKNFSQLTEKNQQLLVNVLQIQKLSDEVLNHYKQGLIMQKDILTEKYSIQYTNNRMIRLYALFGIASVLIMLTIAVVSLTSTTYSIEQKLVVANEHVSNNLKLKNKLVSMISHDIRSPLHIILLYINQVLRLEKNPEKTATYSSMQYTTNSALQLANRILDFSKGENNQTKIYKDRFNLYDEVNQILEAFTALAASQNSQLVNINKLDPTQEVIFDRSKLQRLYFNLMDNAIKYAKDGDIEVQSVLENTTQGSYKFTMTVKDTGIGIPKDQLKKVFEPFQQVSFEMLETQNLGVGLGLYLCKEIVEQFQGAISIESTLNEGTVITAYMLMEKITK